MCVDHVLINICSPVINVDRGNQPIDSSEMAEDALRGNEEGLSAFTGHHQLERVGFAGDRGRDARDGRVHSWLPKRPVAVILDWIHTTY